MTSKGRLVWEQLFGDYSLSGLVCTDYLLLLIYDQVTFYFLFISFQQVLVSCQKWVTLRYELNYVPPNPYIEALTPNVIIMGMEPVRR